METRCSRPSFAWLYESNEPQRFGEMRANVNTPLSARRFGFHYLMPPRRLGQHFLVDDDVVGRIVAAAGISRGELVVEVGPGHGALTNALAGEAERLILLELDPKLASSLERRYAAVDAVSVLEADARYVEIGTFLVSTVAPTQWLGISLTMRLRPSSAISSKQRNLPSEWWRWCSAR